MYPPTHQEPFFKGKKVIFITWSLGKEDDGKTWPARWQLIVDVKESQSSASKRCGEEVGVK